MYNILEESKPENERMVPKTDDQFSKDNTDYSQMAKPGEARESFDKLLLKVKKRKNYGKSGAILFVGAIIAASGLIAFLPKYANLPGIIAGIGLGGMILGGYLLSKTEKRIFDKRQKIFYEIYHAYLELKRYIGIESSRTDHEKKKIISVIEHLANYVGEWTDERAPEDISSLPSSISNNFKKMVLPLIQQDELSELAKLSDFLHMLSLKAYKRDPSKIELQDLNFLLSELKKTDSSKVDSDKKFFNEHPNAKNILAGVASGVILFFILDLSPLGWGSSLATSALVSIGIMTYLGRVRRPK